MTKKGEQRVSNLAIVETILRDRRAFFREVAEGKDLGIKMRGMLISCLAFFALYGAVMGSSHSLWQALSSAAKLPVLFLATLMVCAPTLYFFNAVFGSNQSLMQNTVLMLSGITVTAVLLLSFAPVVLFFLLTTNHYQFFKLLNVLVFSISGSVGVAFLSQGMRLVSQAVGSERGSRQMIVYAWIILYAFVGSQMAWTLRPFIGAPSITEFELFRQLGGNFYANILASLGEVFGTGFVR